MSTIEMTVEGCEEPEWIESAQKFCEKLLKKLALDNWEVSIVFCSNEFIQELNHRFRGKDEPTDVLSFSQNEGENEFPIFEPGIYVAGDIVISLDMVEQANASFKVSPEEELKRLIIHGVLHLSGYNHEDNSPEQEMLVKQEEIVRYFSEEKIF